MVAKKRECGALGLLEGAEDPKSKNCSVSRDPRWVPGRRDKASRNKSFFVCPPFFFWPFPFLFLLCPSCPLSKKVEMVWEARAVLLCAVSQCEPDAGALPSGSTATSNTRLTFAKTASGSQPRGASRSILGPKTLM